MKRLSLFLLLTSFNAFALNIQSYRFSDSYRFSIVDDSYQEKFKGDYVITTSLGYVNTPFYVADKDVTQLESDVIKYQLFYTLGGSYYVNQKLSVGIDINVLQSEVLDEKHFNFGDTTLKARYNVYRENNLSFAVVPKLYLPTGQTDSFSTINSLGGSLSGVGEYKHERWHFLASLGYLYAPNNEFSIVDYRNLILTTAAVSYDLNGDWNVNAEAVKNFTTDRSYRQDEGDYYLTFKYKAHRTFGFYFGAGIAGVDEIDRDNYTVFTGLKFHSF